MTIAISGQMTTRYSEPSRVQVELPSPLPTLSVEALQAAADIQQALTEDVATSNQTLSELRRRLDSFTLCKPKTDCKVNKPIIPEPDTTPDLDVSSSSGGSLSILTLTVLMIFGLRRRPYN